MKMILRWMLILPTLFIVLLILARALTGFYARTRIYLTSDAPTAPVAIVFGAGLRRDGSPTPVLRDRVETAVELYQLGKVQKILMSGDNRFLDYNEPGAMAAYAVELGVPQEDIALDYAGRRTYDTCYRARDIFNVQNALLITQSFHLPRAIYTCNALGVHAVGVSADRRVYHQNSQAFWTLREMPATLVALWELWVSRPIPVLGEPEPILSASEGTKAKPATKPRVQL
jgi:SanA protein